jgi:hypothetical protein
MEHFRRPGPSKDRPVPTRLRLPSRDFNGDGIEDVVVGGTVGVPLSVFFGNGDGTFRPPVVSSFNVGTVLLVVDLNGDGKADLLVGNHYFSALLGNGNGTFQMSPWGGLWKRGLAAGDLNGDGKVDVVYPGLRRTSKFNWAAVTPILRAPKPTQSALIPPRW